MEYFNEFMNCVLILCIKYGYLFVLFYVYMYLCNDFVFIYNCMIVIKIFN